MARETVKAGGKGKTNDGTCHEDVENGNIGPFDSVQYTKDLEIGNRRSNDTDERSQQM